MRRTDTDELKIELEYNGRKVETTSRKLRELAELAKKKRTVSAADYDDTPACELTILPSKIRVKKLLGRVIRFAEPKFFFDSPAARSATLTKVRRSLRGVDSEALDRMLQEERK